MICPECNAEFEPQYGDQLYCNPRCTKRHKDRMYRERYKNRPRKKYPRKVVRVDPAATHPCRKCGENTAKYRQVLCESCKAGNKPRVKGAGVGPLTTPNLRQARRRELELIERVVARSIACGRQGGRDDRDRRYIGRLRGVKIG